MHVPFHTNCREGWGCHPSCPVAALARHAQELEKQLAQLEKERDAWQTRAVNRD